MIQLVNNGSSYFTSGYASYLPFYGFDIFLTLCFGFVVYGLLVSIFKNYYDGLKVALFGLSPILAVFMNAFIWLILGLGSNQFLAFVYWFLNSWLLVLLSRYIVDSFMVENIEKNIKADK